MRTGSVVTSIAATVGLGPAAPPRRALVLPVVSLVTVLLVTALLAAGALLRPPGIAPPTAAAPAPAPAVPAAEPGTVGLGRAVPLRLLIPAIEVDARIAPLGLGEDGLTGAPARQLVGWYRDGTSPGELGSAVLLGQVDPPHAGIDRPAATVAGPALAGLARLGPGDQIEVVRADGLSAQFRVEAVEPYSPTRVVPGSGGEAQLRLVGAHGTGPEWTPQLVVFATLLS